MCFTGIEPRQVTVAWRLTVMVTDISTYRACRRLVREAQEQLQKYAHPDPYVGNSTVHAPLSSVVTLVLFAVPYMPGGSSFMRYSPPPLDVRIAGCELPHIECA